MEEENSNADYNTRVHALEAALQIRQTHHDSWTVLDSAKRIYDFLIGSENNKKTI